ncbi:uncharacterized protein NPIL_362401 [Nephila pilipes]|uniref:Uncharacterized protein n=1 Tax=Nephila pilipes TaxID=299642 RepID=A0A8X6P1D8_NEPPI|nr:uncharacterized protein NPIL_362401 [Nephila pilipes]
MESRFGDSHLTQFYRTELKTRRQKPGERLQVLAADVERLMSLAYAECPLDIWQSLAASLMPSETKSAPMEALDRLTPVPSNSPSRRTLRPPSHCHPKSLRQISVSSILELIASSGEL